MGEAVRAGRAEPAIEALLPDSAGLEAVLDLNNRHAAELSLLDLAALRRMLGQAFRAVRVGEAQAFLIAFDQDADYWSPNFRWFKARHRRFVYVDRVAVAQAGRGRGLARRFYADLFAAARAAGHSLVCCEVNSDPPNPGSDAFHAVLGFQEVGSGAIHGGVKTVRYLERAL